MKILIIDDNRAVRVSLKLVLDSEFDSITAIGDPRCCRRYWPTAISTQFCST